MENKQPTKTEAIKLFLNAMTHSDLAMLYNTNMEVQVNVARDGGERVSGVNYAGRQWLAWTNGTEIWKSFRIPWNANTEPEYKDTDLKFDLVTHTEGVGMTGWDWKEKLSRWVAYDFDAITGHSDKHARKLTDKELQEVKDVLKSIPWVTLRNSTSGKGLHLYVFLNPVSTNNHTEHAALARSILHMLSGLTGVDFQSKVDICGGNMWVWHRKMKGTTGLTLIKQGEVLDEVPENWRDHLNVTRGRGSKNRPSFLEHLNRHDADSVFEELTGQRSRIPLDLEHKKLIQHLHDVGSCYWYDADHHMLVTHTVHLQEAHETLRLRGDFKTIATGTDFGNDHNCFCFPLRNGVWAVRRYGPGTSESPTWDIDDKGWTRCFLNKDLDFNTLCKMNHGKEHPKGGYLFIESEAAERVLLGLGANLTLPNYARQRQTKLMLHPKDSSKIIMEMRKEVSDKTEHFKDFIQEKDLWKAVFAIKIMDNDGESLHACDDLIRHLVTSDREDSGWVIFSEGHWNSEPLNHVMSALQSTGYQSKDVRQIVGSSIFKPWILVNYPFQPEYPGNRQWNRKAAQLRFQPNPERDNLSFPTWNKILQHLGKNLDEAVKKHIWCQSNGINSGAEYLKCWIASVFKNPTEPLPYLFFYSTEQNTGKSTFHEALSRLMTRGYTRADAALVNPTGFNGELESAVICVVEETDLRKNKDAYNRIKDWVTGRTLSIHPKGGTPFVISNTTHWIQCSNDRGSCPVAIGDTRVTMVRVDPVDDLIAKSILEHLLDKEAPDFLADILNLELPASGDRLAVPVIETEEKGLAMDLSRSSLDRFLEEAVFHRAGHYVKVSDFFMRFGEWLDPQEVSHWTKHRIAKEMPERFPRGRLTTQIDNSQYAYGNMTFDKDAKDMDEVFVKIENTIRRIPATLKVISDVDSSSRAS